MLVDAPPLLGLSDVQVLASHCDELLVVSRLRALTLDNCMDTRSTLERLPVHTIGTVVIGGATAVSPYYASRPEDGRIRLPAPPRSAPEKDAPWSRA